MIIDEFHNEVQKCIRRCGIKPDYFLCNQDHIDRALSEQFRNNHSRAVQVDYSENHEFDVYIAGIPVIISPDVKTIKAAIEPSLRD